MRQPRLAARLLHADNQRAAAVERTGGYRIAYCFRHGQALAAEHGFVRLALAFQHHSVGRQHLARLHQQHFATRQPRHHSFFHLRRIRIIRQPVAKRRHQLHQPLGRITRLAPRQLFQIAPAQQQEHKHRHRIEINSLFPPLKQRPKAT